MLPPLFEGFVHLLKLQGKLMPRGQWTWLPRALHPLHLPNGPRQGSASITY